MNSIVTLVQRTSAAAPLTLSPLNATSLRDQAYALLKNAIAETDIYDPAQELRLDERQLTAALGVSRTPIREALSRSSRKGSSARCRGAASTSSASPSARSSR